MTQAIALAADVLTALHGRGLTAGTVESCTGGLVAAALTAAPGSSHVFMGSLVTYANRIKEQLAQVPSVLIEQHGAVSEEVARAMAEGGCHALGVDVCVAITGIAGPGGGSEAKPVGLVHVAAVGPMGMQHQRCMFDGGRDEVRNAAVITALRMMLEVI